MDKEQLIEQLNIRAAMVCESFSTGENPLGILLSMMNWTLNELGLCLQIKSYQPLEFSVIEQHTDSGGE